MHGEHLRFHQIFVDAFEFVFLIFFGIECTNHFQSGQILAGNTVDVIDLFLYSLEFRKQHCHQGSDHDHDQHDC